jgi:hypothetical protein
MSEVGQQRRAPFVLVDRLADMAVEVAIRAFADAERPVDVEGEGLPLLVMLNLFQHPFPNRQRAHHDGS